MNENDWLVAGINNPSFTNWDFAVTAGLTLDNTQFLSPEEYMTKSFIRNNSLFMGDNYVFSPQKFMQYYNQRAYEWAAFIADDYEPHAAVTVLDKLGESNRTEIDSGFGLYIVPNPQNLTVGLGGLNSVTESHYSIRELAKREKIYDPDNGEFEDFSPNDHTLSVANTNGFVDWFKHIPAWFSLAFGKTLVLATWDQDGFHTDPIYQTKTAHHKGEPKLNPDGHYFYEYLGNRPAYGKDVLAWNDTFTIDGYGLNCIDFLDSNDIQKSITGVIFKEALSIAPYFVKGLNNFWGWFQVAREVGRVLPTAYGILTFAFNNNDTPDWINTTSGWISKLTMSTSDYARQNFMSWENVLGNVSMVVGQFGQQQSLSQLINGIRGTSRIISTAEKRAATLLENMMAKGSLRGMSQVEAKAIAESAYLPAAYQQVAKINEATKTVTTLYMGILLNTDIYEDMLDRGVSKTNAALISLGSILLTYGIDSYWHLSEQFLHDPTGDVFKQMRQALKKEYATMGRELFDVQIDSLPSREFSNVALRLLQTGYDKTRRALHNFRQNAKYGTTDFITKVFTGAAQNANEVLASDITKSIYQLAGRFGIVKYNNAGAWENAKERYIMNAVGGAIGAGVFSAIGSHQFAKETREEKENRIDIETLIRNGYADKLKDEVRKAYERGELGSKKLGKSYIETDNGRAYQTVANEIDSQAYAIMQRILSKIEICEATIINHNEAKTDDDLFQQLINNNHRYYQYKSLSSLTNFNQDYRDALDNLHIAEQNYKRALNSPDGDPSTSSPTDQNARRLEESMRNLKNQNVERYKTEYEKALENLKSFEKPEKTLYYIRRLLFAIDPMAFVCFMTNSDVFEYMQQKLRGRDMNKMTYDEINDFWSDFHKSMTNDLKKAYEVGFTNYQELQSRITGVLQFLNDSGEAMRNSQNQDVLKKLRQFNDDYVKILIQMSDLDARQEWETEEDYNKIYTKDTSDTDEEFIQRIEKRRAEVETRLKQNMDSLLRDLNESLNDVNALDYGTISQLLKEFIENNVRGFTNTIGRIIYRNQNNIKPKVYNFLINNLRNISLDNGTINFQLLEKAFWENIYTRDYSQRAILFLQALRQSDLINKNGNNKNNKNEFLTEANRTLKDNPNITLGEFIDNLQNNYRIQNNQRDVISDFNDLVKDNDIRKISLKQIVDDTNLQNPANITNLKTYIDKQGASEWKNIFTLVTDLISNDIELQIISKLEKLTQNDDPLSKGLIQLMQEFNVAFNDGDLRKLLQDLRTNFDGLLDIYDFRLSQEQETALNDMLTYLQYLRAFIYAASTKPDENSVGYNKSVNDFIRQAKSQDQSLDIDYLIEMPDDTAAMYMQAIDGYISQISYWIRVSDAIKNNNLVQSATNDMSLYQAIWNHRQKITRTFNVNDLEFDLLDGIHEITDIQDNGQNAEIVSFKFERLIHENIQKICKTTGLTIVDLIRDHNLLEYLIPDLDTMSSQNMPVLNNEISLDQQPYFCLQYFAMILSEDPAIFYDSLNKKLKDGSEDPTVQTFIPITAQQLSARFCRAIRNETYRQIMQIASSNFKINLPVLSNAVLVQGMTGTGKSDGVASLCDADIKDKYRICLSLRIADNNTARANELANHLGIKDRYTVEKYLTKILGQKQYSEIHNALNDISNESLQNGKIINNQYFSIRNLNGHLVIDLHSNAIQFDEEMLKNAPFVMYLDDAQQINSLDIALLNAFAQASNGSLIMFADPARRSGLSHIGDQAANMSLESIGQSVFYMTRSPLLSLSLRIQNRQLAETVDKFRVLIEEMLVDINNPQLTPEQFNAKHQTYKQLLNRISCSVCTNGCLDGVMVADELSNELVNQLKMIVETPDRSGQTPIRKVAFIGKKNSNAFNKLCESFNRDRDLFVFENLDEIGGMGFDYVIVDSEFQNPDRNSNSLFSFAQDMYSAICCGKSGVIFIDNDISEHIGEQIYEEYTSIAPNLRPAASRMQMSKIATLNALGLDEIMENISKNEISGKSNDTHENVNELNNSDQPGSNNPDNSANLNPTDTSSEEDNENASKERNQINDSDETKNEKIKQSDQNNDAKVDETSNDNTQDKNKNTKQDSPTEKQIKKQLEDDVPCSDAEVDLPEDTPSEIDATIRKYVLEDRIGFNDDYAFYSFLADYISKGDGYPIEVFGNIRFLTVNQERSENGNTIWKVVSTSDKNVVLRNMQCLYANNTIFDTDEKQHNAQKKLNIAVSAIKHMTSWNVLDAIIKTNFTKNNWENGCFYYEFRDVENETRPLNADFEANGIARNGRNIGPMLVYEVVNKQGQKCRFDIGALNDPNTFDNFANMHIRKINNKLSTEKDEAKRDMLQKIKSEFEFTKPSYRVWFDTHVNNFLSIPSDSDIISELVEAAPGGYLLDEHMSFKSLDKPITLEEVRRLYGDEFFISMQVIYGLSRTESRDDFKNDLKGRSVVFISDVLSDPSYHQTPKLIEYYVDKKTGGTGSSSKVLMARLINKPMSFDELCADANEDDPEKDLYGFERQDMDRTIVQRHNTHGIRMFVAIHNALHALSVMQEEFDKFLNGKKYDPAQIKQLMKYEFDLVSRRGIDYSDLKHNLTKTDLDEFHKFNQDLQGKVLYFRFGDCGNGHAEIGQFEVSEPNDQFHLHIKNGHGNFAMLTPELLKLYRCTLQKLHNFFDNKTNNASSETTVAQLLNVNLRQRMADGGFIDGYIDPDNSSHRHTLAGLLHGKRVGSIEDQFLRSLVIVSPKNANVIATTDGQHWTWAAGFIMQFYKLLKNPAHKFNNVSQQKIYGAWNNGKFQPLIDQNVDFEALDNFIQSLNLTIETEDNRNIFSDLFNFIFVGTNENLNTNRNALKVSDAYFTQGFFTDPQAYAFMSQGVGSALPAYDKNGHEITFFPSLTKDTFGLINVRPMQSGAKMSLRAQMKFENIIPQEYSAEETLDVEASQPNPVVKVNTRTDPTAKEKQNTKISLANPLDTKNKSADTDITSVEENTTESKLIKIPLSIESSELNLTNTNLIHLYLQSYATSSGNQQIMSLANGTPIEALNAINQMALNDILSFAQAHFGDKDFNNNLIDKLANTYFLCLDGNSVIECTLFDYIKKTYALSNNQFLDLEYVDLDVPHNNVDIAQEDIRSATLIFKDKNTGKLYAIGGISNELQECFYKDNTMNTNEPLEDITQSETDFWADKIPNDKEYSTQVINNYKELYTRAASVQKFLDRIINLNLWTNDPLQSTGNYSPENVLTLLYRISLFFTNNSNATSLISRPQDFQSAFDSLTDDTKVILQTADPTLMLAIMYFVQAYGSAYGYTIDKLNSDGDNTLTTEDTASIKRLEEIGLCPIENLPIFNYLKSIDAFEQNAEIISLLNQLCKSFEYLQKQIIAPENQLVLNALQQILDKIATNEANQGSSENTSSISNSINIIDMFNYCS